MPMSARLCMVTLLVLTLIPRLPIHAQVYLAKWRETTVAVKVLGALGAGTSSLDDEFPDAAAGKTHPLYESLQKVGQGPCLGRGRA